MTIVTIAFKKPTPLPEHFELPAVKEDEDVEKMAGEDDLQVMVQKMHPSLFLLVRVGMAAIILAGFCFIVAFASYQDKNGSRREVLGMHYKGFCTIPVETRERFIEMQESLNRVPLKWIPDDEVQVFGNMRDLGGSLREKLDITESIEVISVINNGRSIKFIHDFSENTTGIVDDERCFTMELDPDVVLEPVMFVMGIDGNKEFDITRMRTRMEAVLPELDATSKPHILAENCEFKPTYKLERSQAPALRKRSVNPPSSDYIQFSGKHVQEIAINNLQHVLDHERNKATGGN